jgi:hypothetical protein
MIPRVVVIETSAEAPGSSSPDLSGVAAAELDVEVLDLAELIEGRVDDPEWFVDVVIAAGPNALLESRWRVTRANPGCAFILHLEADLEMNAVTHRAIREADLVVCSPSLRDAVAAVPLSPAVAAVPADDAREWLVVIERALAARSAANRLARRQLAFHTAAASAPLFAPQENDDALIR